MIARKAGFTLLEMLLALALLVIVLGAGFTAVRASQRSFNETVSNDLVNHKANRALNKIAQALAGAGQAGLVVTPQFDGVSFQRLSGWAINSPTWSNTTQLSLQYEPSELDNGIDDDGDGFIDECRVVLTEDLGQPEERSVVLVNSVREFLEGELPDGADNNGNGLDDERGLCFEVQESALTIRLTLLRRLPEGGVGLQSLSTSVGFRN